MTDSIGKSAMPRRPSLRQAGSGHMHGDIDGIDSERDRLWDEALALLMRLRETPDDAVLRSATELWRQRSDDHATVWQSAVELDGMMGVAMHRGEKRKVTRRALLVGGALGLSGTVLTAALGPRLLLELEADFITATAEIQPVTLEDGSTVTLGPNSAIRRSFTPTARRVELLAGLAYFDVAHLPERPFTVAAGRLEATALGTAFEVAIDTSRASVAVGEGQVAVSAASFAPQHLMAGEWLRLAPGSDPERGKASAVADWRSGRLVAYRQRIADLVSRIGRWLPGTVLVADGSLGDEVISGVFNLDQPLQALETAVQPFGGKVRQFSPWLTVVTKI